MKASVTIVDRLPAYRAGLAAALVAEGYLIEEPADWREWAGRKGARALMVAVELPEDEHWLSDLLTCNPELVIIGLTDDPCPDSCLRLLTSGRWTMADRSAPISTITKTLELGLAELAVIPVAIAQALSATHKVSSHNLRRLGPNSVRLDDHNLSLLKSLGRGETVAELSHSIGYSEREIYRRLAALYRRFGVSGRSEALVKAARLGMLD